MAECFQEKFQWCSIESNDRERGIGEERRGERERERERVMYNIYVAVPRTKNSIT